MDEYTCDTRPWRYLASAILVRAIWDVRLGMDEAIRWLHGEDAAFFMRILGQDPEELFMELGI